MQPIGNKIQIAIDKPTAGSLDLSSKATAVECGTVVALGKNVSNELKVGDKIAFKAWAVDILTIDSETYYFIDSDSKGLCAII